MLGDADILRPCLQRSADGDIKDIIDATAGCAVDVTMRTVLDQAPVKHTTCLPR